MGCAIWDEELKVKLNGNLSSSNIKLLSGLSSILYINNYCSMATIIFLKNSTDSDLNFNCKINICTLSFTQIIIPIYSIMVLDMT